jgi:exodeoxyribonuclease VII small subunit
MSEELDSNSFNKSYQVLKQTADWLSQQKEPDIDQLVPKVERAMQAYSICKDRLTKVQETLGHYFEKDGAGSGGGDGVVTRVVNTQPSADSEEGDSPF